MNQKYLLYGLGAAALLLVLRGKRQDSAPVAESTTSPGRGKKTPPKVSVPEIRDVHFGPAGEKIIARIQAIQYPAPGVAPAVSVFIPGQTSEINQLYISLGEKLKTLLTPDERNSLYITLGKKKVRTSRESILLEAVARLRQA